MRVVTFKVTIAHTDDCLDQGTKCLCPRIISSWKTGAKALATVPPFMRRSVITHRRSSVRPRQGIR